MTKPPADYVPLEGDTATPVLEVAGEFQPFHDYDSAKLSHGDAKLAAEKQARDGRSAHTVFDEGLAGVRIRCLELANGDLARAERIAAFVLYGKMP